MFKVTYSQPAVRDMMRLPRNLRDRISAKIDALAEDPFAANKNVSALQGRPGYRLRVGKWRVIYELDAGSESLNVLAVKSRERAYR